MYVPFTAITLVSLFVGYSLVIRAITYILVSRELADLAHMLFDAAGDGDYDSVDRLLGLAPMEVGVNSRSTRDGWTPLIRAAYFGREAVVRRLLEEE